MIPRLNISILLWLLCTTTAVYAQAIDSLTLIEIGNQLVQNELKIRDGVSHPGDNCVRDNAGNFLSCLSAESSVEWVTDFNKDGQPDAVFIFTDEGLGGGGNAYGFEYRVVLLDDKRHIINQHALFGGGKFSYGHLDINEVQNGKIFATYNENPMSRPYGEGEDNLKRVALSFSLWNNKIIEDHYTYCPLSPMKKQIFKKDIGLKIDSILELDDQFNETCTETVLMQDGSKFIASLSGCEDLELNFSRTIRYKVDLEANVAAMKDALLGNLLFLKDNTVFKTIINNAIVQVRQLEISRIKAEKDGGITLHLSQADGWKSHLFISGNKEQGSFITIRFEKPKNKTGMMDFWESMHSKRRLR